MLGGGVGGGGGGGSLTAKKTHILLARQEVTHFAQLPATCTTDN